MKYLILFIFCFSSYAEHEIVLGIGESILEQDYVNKGKDGLSVDFYYIYKKEDNGHLRFNIHRYNKERLDISSINMSYQYDLSPYFFALAGLGFYQIKQDIRIETKTQPGYNLGLGTQVKIENLSLGFLWHFHDPMDSAFPNNPAFTGRYHKAMLTLGWSF